MRCTLLVVAATMLIRWPALHLTAVYAAHTVSEIHKALEQAVARVLKPLGYTKRAATWHLDREQVISVVNLQKSQWGEDWYLNLGVYVKALGDENRPAEARCHIRCRAETLGGGDMPRDPVGLSTLVTNVAVPWLEALADERGVARFVASKRSSTCFVHRRAREMVETSPDAPAA